ncbi:MAG: 16S rRNA (cytosine(967)-C(5))-methyltransferase RsmB [Candidatus Cloacimonadota bacterium]|nr:16S rRNA (cytosine(967)-C(5))-methyltransferase RsmB [Candidatus Cloacimonadota bacterium]
MENLRFQAYQIIVKVLKKNVFSDKLLHKLSDKLKVSKENASFVYSLVKGVIKRKKNLDFICRKYVKQDKFDKTDLKIKTVLYMALYQILYMDSVPEHAAVNESVALAKKIFGQKVANFVNAVVRSYLRNPKIEYPKEINKRLAVEYSFPEYIIDDWLKYFDEEATEMLCMHFNDIPNISIRINKLATSNSKLENYFKKKDVTLVNSEGSSSVYTSKSVKEILKDVALSEGYYSVQDASAAMVVEIMDPMPGESIIDFFAAPGGKSTFIAEKMKNKGELVSIDKSPSKIKKLKRALERLQLNIVNTIAKDSFKYGPVAPAYDKVLLDVPCSGWGVFQKKAELRWQQNQDIKKLIKLQYEALEQGARFVKPGGYLIYSTCTMNDAENEKQVERFLQKNKNFNLVQPHDFVPKKYIKDNYLKTIPHLHQMDGAFAAKMRKKEG